MKLDIVKHKFIYLAISAILLIPGIIAMVYSMITYPTHTPVKVGIDYTGGTTLQYGVKNAITNETLTTVRNNLESAGIETPILQIININSKDNEGLKAILSVRTKFIEEGSDEVNKISTVMNQEFGSADLVQVASVGPTLGSELFKNSMIALSLALLGIVAYLTIRFQFDYALAAILGLVHDTVFVIGVFSILGLLYGVQIDALFVTALLTVIGFSVHDTIVVFDRVRENLKYYSKKMTFGEIMNASINQTLTRSINTS
ncbi:protein translocase subunit SecF, partial [bacterium]|nr:protein translocase subunit SecF [bacterium]